VQPVTLTINSDTNNLSSISFYPSKIQDFPFETEEKKDPRIGKKEENGEEAQIAFPFF